MTVIIGSGRKRQAFVVPTGDVLKRFSDTEQLSLISDMKSLLGFA